MKMEIARGWALVTVESQPGRDKIRAQPPFSNCDHRRTTLLREIIYPALMKAVSPVYGVEFTFQEMFRVRFHVVHQWRGDSFASENEHPTNGAEEQPLALALLSFWYISHPIRLRGRLPVPIVAAIPWRPIPSIRKITERAER